MKKTTVPALLASVVALAILGCEESTTSSAPQDFNASHRTISASLRASCSDSSNGLARSMAGRALDTGIQVVLRLSPAYRLQLRVYDSAGSFVTHGESVGRVDSIATQRIYVTWNGVDTTGAFVGTGHYFLFERFLDSTGTVVKVDSACYSWIRG